MKFIVFLLLISQGIVLSQNKDTLRVLKLQVDTTSTFGLKKSLSNNPVKVAEPTNLPTKDSDLFLIRKNGFYGFIDREGNIIIKPQFYSANDFSEGLAYADLGFTSGFIDKTGKLIIDLKSYTSDYFSDGIARINYKMWGTDGGGMSWYKYIDKDANLLFGESYVYATPFKEGYAFVKTREGVRLISKESLIAELPLEITPYEFSEGMARFYKQISGKLKWGFIDTTGSILINPNFDDASNFSEGMTAVAKEDTSEFGISHLYGFINKKGEIIIDMKYNYVFDFSGGFALARIDSTCFGINKNGDEVFSLTNFYPGGSFSSPKYSEGLALGKFWKRNERYICRYIDTTGNSIIVVECGHADNYRNGLARVGFDNDIYGEWGYINKKGEIIFDPRSVSPSIIPDSLKNFRRKPGIQ